MERNEQSYECGKQYAQDVQASGVPFGEELPEGEIALDPLEAAQLRDVYDELRHDPQYDPTMQQHFSTLYDTLDGYLSRWD